MQRKLSRWAEQDKTKQFDGLFDLLCDKDWLRLAHDHVAQKAGSRTAGCDGITRKAFDEDLAMNLQRLRQRLQTETFEPYPVRRVYIPKANGKLRALGIPCVADRIVQEALRMVLEPIVEADFSPDSFGFRPTRSARDAIKWLLWSTQESKKFFWCIEGDIASYFDTVHQQHLVKLLRRRIKDEWLMALIWKFLRAGVMEGKRVTETRQGVPQGGIVSPLFSNVYLTELDRYMERYTALSHAEKTRRRQRGQGNYVYLRYADDCAVLCNGTKAQAQALKEELTLFLKETLKLELSWEKTKITHLKEGFEFLGFRIVRSPGHKGMTTKVLIPQKAVKQVRAKIARPTAPTTHRDSVNTTILALNRLTGGWGRYYQYTSYASSTFNQVEDFTFWRMAHWLGRKFRLTMPRVLRRFKRDSSLATSEQRLLKATEFPTQISRQRFLKPNPYTTQQQLTREDLPHESDWTGCDPRPGMADLRPLVFQRDQRCCRKCGVALTADTAVVDHIRPVRRFRRPVEANRLENLQTLCPPCHTAKTELDRQRERPLPGKLVRRVRRRV